jgi:hypothetical protein
MKEIRFQVPCQGTSTEEVLKEVTHAFGGCHAEPSRGYWSNDRIVECMDEWSVTVVTDTPYPECIIRELLEEKFPHEQAFLITSHEVNGGVIWRKEVK